MRAGNFRKLLLLGASVSAVGIVSSQDSVLAQDATAAAPRTVAQYNALNGPVTSDHGMQLGDWAFYPNLFAGFVYNDNINNSNSNRKSGSGLRLRPTFTFERDAGIHKTTVSAYGDLQLYDTTSSHASNSSNIANAGVDVTHVYEAQRDLLFRFEGTAVRSNDIFNSGLTQNNGVLGTTVIPQVTNQFSTSASVQKTFGNAFAGLGFSVQRTTYGATNDVLNQPLSQSYRDMNQYMVSGRLGWHFGADFYTFVDPSVNWRRYDSGSFDSNGYAVNVGIGTDRFSLFTGEIYVGYAAQSYSNTLISNSHSPTFGGRVGWTPTRDITVSANVARTLGEGSIAPVLGQALTSSTTTTAQLNGSYKITDYWSLSTKVGYGQSTYSGSRREDARWMTGLAANYTFWRNWALTAEYEYSRLNVNIANASFDRNMLTLGATYHY